MTAMTGLTIGELQALAAAGGAAPSLHNSQPWRFRPTADGRGLEVHADPARAVPVADPDGRALHLSVGAAVFNLRVAAAHLDRPAVVRLLPDPARPTLLAHLDLDGPGALEPWGGEYHAAIGARHSSRQPFTNRDVPETVLGELIAAARDEHAELAVLEEDGVRRVLALTADGEERIGADPAAQAETRSWLRPEPGRSADGDGSAEGGSADGIPVAVLGPLDHDARVPMRSFGGHPPTAVAPHSQRFEALPQIATLTTRGDRPADWLAAGQAMERVWLLATVHGVRASVLHQAVELPDLRWQLRDPDSGPGHVQLVLRLGYGPPGPASPRRPVADVLDLAAYRGGA